ncbi:hypothetical protein [Methanoplanus endosymbiosus]|uniref:Uncharacterized protein n=1 Tax=Methanoplanus endosymbiosus TaxID=33865 RepID=A0A9E7PSP7_9EURY|nr:hypothetical protein [Methanoplanus endosymbiosus]UUX93052.1 hypothetical protein L6E24_02730 [Methanoplanus endosymbiosus]
MSIMNRWRFRKKAFRKRSYPDNIMKISPDVKTHSKTEEISPVNIIPGLECEGTEIGIAEVEKKKTVYIRLWLKKEF